MKHIFNFILAAVLALASCERVVTFDIPEIPASLVVNSFFSPDSLLSVHLSNTMELNEFEPETIENATIQLYEEDKLIDTLVHNGDGIYTHSSFLPGAGHSYTLKVSAAGYNSVSSTDYTPRQKIQPFQIQHFPDAIRDEEGFLLNEARFSINDSAGEQNYYELKIMRVEPGQKGGFDYTTMYITSKDPSITTEGDLYYYPQTLLFTDELFNGTTKELRIYFGRFSCSGNCPEPFYLLQFRTVSANYFQYKKKLLRHLANQSSDIWNGEANPVQMYTNVENGYGIFVAYSQTIDTLKQLQGE